MDHTNVEGVVSASFRTGASRRCPSLERATPWGVPFSNSSSRDWVQRWVPCARAGRAGRAAKAATSAGKVNAKRRRRFVRAASNILPLSLLKSARYGVFSVRRKHAERLEPCLHQVGPSGDGEVCAPQAEGV